MRVVIDSNVWISALVFGGNPRRIIKEAIDNGWAIVVSEEIFTEVRRIINTKFSDFVDDFESLQAVLLPYIDTVKLGRITVTECRDDDDNRVLETAVIGDASAIVTGDKDLLVLLKYKNIDIKTPAQFLYPIATDDVADFGDK